MPNDEENHHVVLSWLLGESHDPVELLESYLMSNILLDNSASPLRKVLENTDLGKKKECKDAPSENVSPQYGTQVFK